MSEKLQQCKEVDGKPILSGDDDDDQQQPRGDQNHVSSAVAVAVAATSLFVGKVVEDRVSTGSVESAVVDEAELEGPHLVDSGDSYFSNDDNYPPPAAAGNNCVQPEEDDVGSDDGQNYFPTHVFQDHSHSEGEPMGWWVWS